MKKNAMLKIAAILMVAVLLTTCAISSTFAKYITTGSDSVEARVAGFGYELTTEITSDGFLTDYATTDTSKYSGANSVSSSITPKDLVVAPGTSGTLSYTSGINATGKHEVAVAISSKAEFTWSYEDYCPIIFTIGGETYATDVHDADHTYDTVAKLMNAINGLLSFDYYLAPGATTVTVGEDEVAVTELFEDKNISWSWEYDHEGDSDADDDGIKEIDELDTILGNYDEDVKLGFSLTQSITQID